MVVNEQFVIVTVPVTIKSWNDRVGSILRIVVLVILNSVIWFFFNAELSISIISVFSKEILYRLRATLMANGFILTI